MRHTPEVLLIGTLSAFAVTGWAATELLRYDADEPPTRLIEPVSVGAHDPPTTAGAWFEEMRRFCNPVEVQTALERVPPPATEEGAMYEAACYALAGRIERARASIQRLPSDLRYRAAGVVFDAGHPAADAGDDIAAGPLMEFVVEFWPNHYMALYHAGAARFDTGSYDVAAGYLRRFLEEYSADDGWRASATGMLDAIER